MLRLHLLGPLELGQSERNDRGDVLAQPKRFALLAYLAVSAGLYQRRDSLLALLWPELDDFAARRALRQTLHQLRRALGDEVFVSRGDDEIMVDRAALWCDIVALREAVHDRRYDDAIALYRGELLEGFHISHVGEGFDSWLSRERAESLKLALKALDAVVSAHEREGHAADAAQWAVRAAQLSPLDEPWMRRAVAALDAGGDRSGALRLADTFVHRLETELEARPSAETRALLTRLRLSNSPPLPAHLAQGIEAARKNEAEESERDAARIDAARREAESHTDVATATPPVSVAGVARNSAQPASIASPDHAPASDTFVSAKPRARWAWKAALAAAVIILAGGAVALRARARDVPHARKRVLVTEFANRTGDPALDALGEWRRIGLTRNMVASPLVDVVDRHVLFERNRLHPDQMSNLRQLAQSTGAALVITGSYYRSADSLLFFAGIVDANGQVLSSVGPLSVLATRPLDGVEAVRSRMMTLLSSIIDPRWSNYLNRQIEAAPPRFEAYRPFIEGWEQFWVGNFRRSDSLFRVAAQFDTGFVAAKIALATGSANEGLCFTVDSIARLVQARSSVVDPMDHLDMDVAIARCHGRNEEMLRLAMQRTRMVSTGTDAEMSTAGAALWAGHFKDARDLLLRPDVSVALAAMPVPLRFRFWEGLTEAEHMLGEHDAEVAAANHVAGPNLQSALLRGRAIAALGQSAEALQLLDSSFTYPVEPSLTNGMLPNMDGRPELTGTAAWVALWVAHELHVHGDSIAGRTAATRAASWIGSLPRADRESPEMQILQAEFLEQAGAIPSATKIMERLVAEDTANSDFVGELGGLEIENGDSVRARRIDAWLASVPPSVGHWGVPFWRARMAVLDHRDADAINLLRQAMEAGAWPYWIHSDPTLHRLAARPDYIALMRPRS